MAGWLERYKPAVRGRTLIALAGAVWIGVGAMLVAFAVHWFRASHAAVLGLACAGLACGLVIHHFGFLRIVDRNLGRIRATTDKRCAFGFMPARSYLLVAVMMATGALLRHSPVPKPYLAVLYLAIGAALVLSSVRYLRVLLQG